VTIYTVDVHETTHTCPGNPEPHGIDVRRRVAHITPGGHCQTPVTIRVGHTTTVIDCGRHEPAERQCRRCRNTVITGDYTQRHLGHQAPATTPAHIGQDCA
jgi:hypothetical protein